MKKKEQKIRRQTRTRAKIQGTKQRPRLTVFRSNRLLYAQLINDEQGKTLLGVSTKHVMGKEKKKPIDIARDVGKMLAREAKKHNITQIVFDRGGYSYHGRIKALADGAREGGLEF